MGNARWIYSDSIATDVLNSILVPEVCLWIKTCNLAMLVIYYSSVKQTFIGFFF